MGEGNTHTPSHTQDEKQMQKKYQGCQVIKPEGIRQAVSCMMGEGYTSMFVGLDD